MVNNIQLTWKLAWLLRAYKKCNSTVRFSKYEFHNKLLGGVILFRIILGITWIQHTHIYIDSHSSLGITNTTSSCAKVVSGCGSPSGAQVWHPMPALCGLHNFNVWIKNQWGLCGVGVFELYFWTGGTFGLTQLYLEMWDNNYTRESPFFFSKKKVLEIYKCT